MRMRIRWFLARRIRIRYFFLPVPTCNSGFIKLFSFRTKYYPELTISSIKWWLMISNFMPTYPKYEYIFFFISINGRIRILFSQLDPDPWKKMSDPHPWKKLHSCVGQSWKLWAWEGRKATQRFMLCFKNERWMASCGLVYWNECPILTNIFDTNKVFMFLSLKTKKKYLK